MLSWIFALCADKSHCRVQETIDGDLAVRVFGLLRMVDSGFHQGRYGERSRQRLDIAILSFFQSFRKVYVGEQVMHSSKVKAPLTIPVLKCSLVVSVSTQHFRCMTVFLCCRCMSACQRD